MALLPHLKVNGVPFKNPTSLKPSSYNLTDSGRVATGKMTIEIIARKAKFEVRYDVLSGDELDLIKGQIDNGKPFFTVEHLDNGKYKTYTMYAGAITYEHFRQHMGWYWKDVAFDLIEQ